MTKLEAVRAAIIKAVPEIQDRVLIYGDGHHCIHHPDDPAHGDSCYKVPASEIRLADILVAMYEKMRLETNLRTDELSQQSPECISFIHSILCV